MILFLQVLEGESFDISVMDFVDRYYLQYAVLTMLDCVLTTLCSHCEAFDSLEEENRLEFTQIHRSFVEHIEALITFECAEMVSAIFMEYMLVCASYIYLLLQGITPDLFYDACKMSRKTRDVNMSVFERSLTYLSEDIASILTHYHILIYVDSQL
jgi:The ARF-like 2 binding protein BART